jgi:hypothetical protein
MLTRDDVSNKKYSLEKCGNIWLLIEAWSVNIGLATEKMHDQEANLTCLFLKNEYIFAYIHFVCFSNTLILFA